MIFEFVDVLGRRLIAWGVASFAAGTVAIVVGSALWVGIGAMLLALGLAGAALGTGVRVLGERRRRQTIGDQARRDRDRRRIRVALSVGVGLGVLVVGLGTWLAASAGEDAWRSGAGVGLGIQGGLAILSGLAHVRWIPRPGPLLPTGLELFAGSGHDGFRLSRVDREHAGDGPSEVPGALLVHGFAGSPKELRGLAAVLASRGWLVEVPCLPGHGADFGQVADVRVEDWIRSVEEAAAALRASGATTLLVAGHAVGGSLALATAARVAPDAIVLLAPFCRPLPTWQRAVVPVLRVFLPPGFRAFGRMDLGDPAVAARLRDLQVPLTLLEQQFRVSTLAAKGARAVEVPVLAIQGLSDTVSRPSQTRALLEQLPTRPTYLEVDAGHDLVTEASPVRDQVLGSILAFAEAVAHPPDTPWR